MMLELTRHAAARLQKRAIPLPVVEWILDYGVAARRHGADVIALDKRGRRRLRRDLGQALYDRVRACLDAYVVISDQGTVVTAGWRLKRLKAA